MQVKDVLMAGQGSEISNQFSEESISFKDLLL
jgi:hypothetical protein